ncbi:MAG TPA: DUF4397 domain-containing protein [Gemmatimonadaceae bacterium]|nr:DUF4397 domain-containing protein [Gemmatimonadaceae bacterium]
MPAHQPRRAGRAAPFAAALVALAATLVACAGDGPAATSERDSAIQVVNGVAGAVRVTVDGELLLAALGPGAVSPPLRVSAGQHEVTVTADGVSRSASVAAGSGGVYAVAVGTDAGALSARVLPDTATIPAPGTAKLRVVHLAADAPPLSVWRTQPDVDGPVQVMFPFPYGSESGYLQGPAGTWRVWVSPLETVPPNAPGDTATYRGSPTPELAGTGPIVLAEGEVRTAVLLRDAAGTLRFEVLAGAP